MFASIRFRLTAWYFCSLVVILAVFALGAWFAMGGSMLRAVNHDLRLRIGDIRQFIEHDLAASPGELTEDFREQAELGLGGGLLEVRDGDGRVLYRSTRLGAARLGQQGTAAGSVQYATERSGHLYMRIASQTVDVQGRRFTIHVAEPLHEFQESREWFERILLIWAVVALILAALGGFWMSGRALAPVDRITFEVRRISISSLSTRLQPPAARDELQRLVLTLNEMLERIDSAVRRMVQFTADASHELRAPLTLIHTAAEFSLRRERTHQELLDAMRRIVRESGRTSRLVDDLLLLARADSASDAPHLAPTDVRGSVRNAVEQAMTMAEPKEIRVSAAIPEEPVVVEGDEQALSRLWLILLDNAVKYTNDGGHINLAIRTADSQAEVVVKDNGVGIAAVELPYVFDRFWRADKVRSRSLGGSGLGLSIAKWIVQRHHGSIEVRSELGKGAQFVIRIPLRAGVAGASQWERVLTSHNIPTL